MGRLIQEIRRDVGRTITYDYFAAGTIKTKQLESLDSTVLDSWSYTYYDDNKPCTITHLNEGITTFYYDSRGRLEQKEYPDGSYTGVTYLDQGSIPGDARNLVDTISHHAGGVEEDYTYTYDSKGNITQVVNGTRVTTYTYDGLDRLLTERMVDGGTSLVDRSYTYDGSGNRLTNTDNLTNTTTTYTYDVDNKLSSSTNPSVTCYYYYDADGNLTDKTDGSETTHYDYDYENQLYKVTPVSGPAINFYYTSDGERYQRYDTQPTTFVFAGGDLVQELNVVGEPLASYNPGISQTAGGATKYFHGDLLGSTVEIVMPAVSPTRSPMMLGATLLSAAPLTRATSSVEKRAITKTPAWPAEARC